MKSLNKKHNLVNHTFRAHLFTPSFCFTGWPLRLTVLLTVNNNLSIILTPMLYSAGGFSSSPSLRQRMVWCKFGGRRRESGRRTQKRKCEGGERGRMSDNERVAATPWKTGIERQSRKSKKKKKKNRGKGWTVRRKPGECRKEEKGGGDRMENSVGVWFMPGEPCFSLWGCPLIP